MSWLTPDELRERLSDPTRRWLELAKSITSLERTHRQRSDDAWNLLDVTTAVHHRGIADGLALARERQLYLSQESESGEST